MAFAQCVPDEVSQQLCIVAGVPPCPQRQKTAVQALQVPWVSYCSLSSSISPSLSSTCQSTHSGQQKFFWSSYTHSLAAASACSKYPS